MTKRPRNPQTSTKAVPSDLGMGKVSAHTERRTLLMPDAALRLTPIAADAEFPEAQAAHYRLLSPQRGRSLPGDLSRIESKRLAAAYRAAPDPVAEADDAAEVPVEDMPGLSIPGIRPRHIGFDPHPLAALIHPRLRPHLPELESAFTARIKLGAPVHFYPWCTVGRIFRSYPPYTSEHGWASGFMFGGRVMITARHAFPKNIHETFSNGARYRFVPGYDAGATVREPYGSAFVTNVRGKEKDSGSFLGDGFFGDPNGWDYAACRLDWRIGDLSGSMGTYSFHNGDDFKNKYYSSTGYPSYAKGRPVQEILAKVRDVDGSTWERELETVNFAAPGWSGGPLFGYLDASGDTRVVGVCSGSEWMDSILPPYNNCVWAGGHRFIALCEYTVQNWWT